MNWFLEKTENNNFTVSKIDNFDIFELDGNDYGFSRSSHTPRNEVRTNTLIANSNISFNIKVLEAIDYKEFTISQLATVINKKGYPIIRIAIIDNYIYVIYKNKNLENEKYKLFDFELNKDYIINYKIENDFLYVNNFCFDKWFKKYYYKVGIYPQSNYGKYKVIAYVK